MSMSRIGELRAKMQEANMSAALVSEISDYMLSMSEDLCYYRSILDGSWPSARRIMLQTLLMMEKED